MQKLLNNALNRSTSFFSSAIITPPHTNATNSRLNIAITPLHRMQSVVTTSREEHHETCALGNLLKIRHPTNTSHMRQNHRQRHRIVHDTKCKGIRIMPVSQEFPANGRLNLGSVEVSGCQILSTTLCLK